MFLITSEISEYVRNFFKLPKVTKIFRGLCYCMSEFHYTMYCFFVHIFT